MAEGLRTAGTLTGAILESAGYHYQSAILDALQSPFENEVGGLIYLIGIVIAIAITATQGRYQIGTWLLIGPPIFFSVIQVRDTIPNARWEFGLQSRPQDQVEEGVDSIVASESEANVSKLFGRYVEVISVVVKELVAKISEGREDADKWFILKGQLFAAMHTAEIEDAGFKQLLHSALYIDCADLIRWGKSVNDPLFREKALQMDERSQEIAEELAGRPESQESRNFLDPTQAFAEAMYNHYYTLNDKNIKGEAARFVAEMLIAEPGFPLDPASASPEQLNAAITQLAQGIEGRKTNCLEIWGYTLKAIMIHARRKHEQLRAKAEEWGVDEAAIDNILLQGQGVRREDPTVLSPTNQYRITPTDTEQIAEIIAKYFLRNEEGNEDPGSWIAWYSNRHNMGTMRVRRQAYSSFAERARLNVKEWGEQERLLHAATSLPYFQGLGLFFLGTAFPFFALLLLVPGKQGGFLLWFVLWLWLKTWDIGFAVAMLLDDILFALFAVNRQSEGGLNTLSEAAKNDVGTAVASLQHMDPTFSLTTYYTIVATCILAVPPTTAQLVLGSMRSGALLLAKGAESVSRSFGDAGVQHSSRVAVSQLMTDAALLKHRAGRLSRSYLRQGLVAQDAIRRAEFDNDPASGLQVGPRHSNPGTPSGIDPAAASAALPGDPAQTVPGDAGALPLGSSADRRQAGIEAAERAGAAEGLAGPYEFLGSRGAKLNSLLRVATRVSALNRFADLSRFQSMREFTAAETAFAAAMARYDAAIGQQKFILNETIGLYGALPISSVNFHSNPAPERIKLRLAHFNADLRRRRAFWERKIEIAKIISEEVDSALTDARGKTLEQKMAALQAMPAAERQSVTQAILSRLGQGGGWMLRTAAVSGAWQYAEQAEDNIVPRAVDQVQNMMADWFLDDGSLDSERDVFFVTRDMSPEQEVMLESHRYVTPKSGSGDPRQRLRTEGAPPFDPPER